MNPTTTTLNLSIHGQNNTGQNAIYLVFPGLGEVTDSESAFKLAVKFSKVGEISKLVCETERDHATWDCGVDGGITSQAPKITTKHTYRDALHIQMKQEQSVLVDDRTVRVDAGFQRMYKGTLPCWILKKHEERSTLSPMIKNIYQIKLQGI
ncbi:hypothetical protein D5086_018620 [Populus alba]|uniref:Uncharacterized protein n=1 Tax=Populus alba TaxID=43335 RepID=A0ACC4BQX5_POPAL